MYLPPIETELDGKGSGEIPSVEVKESPLAMMQLRHGAN
jgi:hypothetical protein